MQMRMYKLSMLVLAAFVIAAAVGKGTPIGFHW